MGAIEESVYDEPIQTSVPNDSGMVADWAARAQHAARDDQHQDSGHSGVGEGEAAEVAASDGPAWTTVARGRRPSACTSTAAPTRADSDNCQPRAAAAGAAGQGRRPDEMKAHLDTMAQERVEMLRSMAEVEQRLAQREAEAGERRAREAEARAQIELLRGQIAALKRREDDRMRSDGPDRKGLVNARQVAIERDIEEQQRVGGSKAAQAQGERDERPVCGTRAQHASTCGGSSSGAYCGGRRADDDYEDDDGYDSGMASSDGDDGDAEHGLGMPLDKLSIRSFSTKETEAYQTSFERHDARAKLGALREALETHHPAIAELFELTGAQYVRALRYSPTARAVDTFVKRTIRPIVIGNGEDAQIFMADEQALRETAPIEAARGRATFERMAAYHDIDTSRKRRQHEEAMAATTYIKAGSAMAQTKLGCLKLRRDFQLLPKSKRAEPNALLRRMIEEVPEIEECAGRTFAQRLADELDEYEARCERRSARHGFRGGEIAPWDFAELVDIIALRVEKSERARTAAVGTWRRGGPDGGTRKQEGGAPPGPPDKGTQRTSSKPSERNPHGKRECFRCGKDASECGGLVGGCRAKGKCGLYNCPSTYGGKCVCESAQLPQQVLNAVGGTLSERQQSKLAEQHAEKVKARKPSGYKQQRGTSMRNAHPTAAAPEEESDDEDDGVVDLTESGERRAIVLAKKREQCEEDVDFTACGVRGETACLLDEVDSDGSSREGAPEPTREICEDHLLLECTLPECTQRAACPLRQRAAPGESNERDDRDASTREGATARTEVVCALTQVPAKASEQGCIARFLSDTGADTALTVQPQVRNAAVCERSAAIAIDGVGGTAYVGVRLDFWACLVGTSVPFKLVVSHAEQLPGVNINVLSHSLINRLTGGYVRYEPELRVDMPHGPSGTVVPEQEVYWVDVAIARSVEGAMQLAMSMSDSATVAVTLGARVGDEAHLWAARMCVNAKGLKHWIRSVNGVSQVKTSEQSTLLINNDLAYRRAWTKRPAALNAIPPTLQVLVPGHTMHVDHWASSIPCFLTGHKGMVHAVDACSDYGYSRSAQDHKLLTWIEFLRDVLLQESALGRSVKLIKVDAAGEFRHECKRDELQQAIKCAVRVAAGDDHEFVSRAEARNDTLTRMTEASMWSARAASPPAPNGALIKCRLYQEQVLNLKPRARDTVTRHQRHRPQEGAPDIKLSAPLMFYTTVTFHKIEEPAAAGLPDVHGNDGRAGQGELIAFRYPNHYTILNDATGKPVTRKKVTPVNEHVLLQARIAGGAAATDAATQCDGIEPLQVLQPPPAKQPARPKEVIKHVLPSHELPAEGERIELLWQDHKGAGHRWHAATVLKVEVQSDGTTHHEIKYDGWTATYRHDLAKEMASMRHVWRGAKRPQQKQPAVDVGEQSGAARDHACRTRDACSDASSCQSDQSDGDH